MHPTTALMLTRALDADRERQRRHQQRFTLDRPAREPRPSVWSAMIDLRRTGLTPDTVLGV